MLSVIGWMCYQVVRNSEWGWPGCFIIGMEMNPHIFDILFHFIFLLWRDVSSIKPVNTSFILLNQLSIRLNRATCKDIIGLPASWKILENPGK